MNQNISFTILDDSDKNGYEFFLSKHDHVSLYYSYRFRLFLEALLNTKSTYLLAKQKNIITGILPLMTLEGEYGNVLNSLPFYGSNGGIIAENDQVRFALYQQYNLEASKKNVLASTVITHPFEVKNSFLGNYDFIDSRIGQITFFPEQLSGQSIDDWIFSTIEGTTRRNIRKAVKDGVSVSVDNDILDELEVLHASNMNDINGISKPTSFFKLLPKYMRPNKDYKIYKAMLKDKIISILLLFYYNKTVEYYIPATIRTYRNIQPMALILFQAFQDAILEGYQYWNWGGTWETQENVYSFKKKWGAKDFRYYYYTKINENSILKVDPNIIRKMYPNFYVFPFSQVQA